MESKILIVIFGDFIFGSINLLSSNLFYANNTRSVNTHESLILAIDYFTP